MVLCINRIRLEFKVLQRLERQRSRSRVLIESDWNLKKLDKLVILAGYFGINRIRLEFKEGKDKGFVAFHPLY